MALTSREKRELMDHAAVVLRKMLPPELGMLFLMLEVDEDHTISGMSVVTNLEGNMPDVLRGLADECADEQGEIVPVARLV